MEVLNMKLARKATNLNNFFSDPASDQVFALNIELLLTTYHGYLLN